MQSSNLPGIPIRSTEGLRGGHNELKPISKTFSEFLPEGGGCGHPDHPPLPLATPLDYTEINVKLFMYNTHPVEIIFEIACNVGNI